MEDFYFDYGGAIPELPDELMDFAESDDNGCDGDKSSSVSRDLTISVEQPELGDWHQDLLNEIQKLREAYLPEIKNTFRRICAFWSQSPEAANKADGDKRFLESALKILALAWDDKIERPKNECFHVLTLIESYVLRSRNENLTKPYEKHPEAPALQYQVGAAVSGDPFVQIELVELAEWKEDLREEVEWMKWMLLPEINQAYIHVCRLLSQSPESVEMKEDKKFIEFALNFLDLTDDKIKWPKNECFDIVRRIKSYVLHLRDTKFVEQHGEHLWKPQCQFQLHELQQQLNNKIDANLSLTSTACCGVSPLNAVPCEPLSTSKWARLANRHNRMYEEFVSLRNDFLAIVTLAFRMYSKLSLKNRKKYLPLAFNFEFCMKFLSFSTSDMLLISKDQFDYYARKIKMLVAGTNLSIVTVLD